MKNKDTISPAYYLVVNPKDYKELNNRLEKLEKATKIIKDKKVDVQFFTIYF